MRIFGDYHTHTIFSRNHHGKSTIEENVQVAVSKGLKEIAISDHGFNHLFFGVRRKNIEFMRNECKTLSEKYGIKVYLSIESNLISSKGDIDLTEKDKENFDIILMGYHKAIRPKTLKDFFFFIFKNFQTKKQIQKNTEAYIQALSKNKINVITHLNVGMKVNVEEVAKKAAETGTLIELNGKRINFSKNDVENMLKTNVKFIINSDAHKCTRVGETNLGMNFAIKNNIPFDRIVNIDKTPNFN